MISIKNIKLIADLEDELQKDKDRLEYLKTSKAEVIHRKAVDLLRRIQRFLEHNGLSTKNQDSNLQVGFISSYKNKHIRGEVDLGGTEIRIYFDGEVVRSFKVVPAPSSYTLLGKEHWDNDNLAFRIQGAYNELERMRAVINSVEKDNFVYASTDETSPEIIGDEEAVLKNLFL